jgi:branched-subunit amino acid aminotransferase/4-amino-4-deoxychorismate lyase
MHEFVFFDGQIRGRADSRIGASSSAALYGKGVFTTIAIYNGEPFLWGKHWRRLRDSSAKLDIDIAEFSEEATKKALYEIIEQNGVVDSRARITFFDESTSAIWRFESERKTSLLIATANSRPVPENFCVEISMNLVSSVSKLAALKSCNYLDNILAYEETKRRGFEEAIRLNERGEVVGACMANVFWLKDGNLCTPSLKTGCLPGTTREFILENMECREVNDLYDQIHRAEAIFLTSAGLGVAWVSELKDKKLTAINHPILALIRAI